MPDFVLTLGGVAFASLEVPESIRMGGDTLMATHKYPGGTRTVDFFGADDAPIEWAGYFDADSGDAELRCQQIDSMRRQGLQQTLQFSATSYQVVIKRFTWEFRRYYWISYEIALEVVQANVQSAPDQDMSDPDDLLSSDYGDAYDYSANLAGINAFSGQLPVSAMTTLGGAYYGGDPLAAANIYGAMATPSGILAANVVGGCVWGSQNLPSSIAAIASAMQPITTIASATSAEVSNLSSAAFSAQQVAAATTGAFDAAITNLAYPTLYASGIDPRYMAASVNQLVSVTSSISNSFCAYNNVSRMGVVANEET